jgi:RHS repeat-associated protein
MYYVHADHLDRPVMMTNLAGANVWSAVWSPFGAAFSITGSLTENQRFPGQWFQIESGLHWNWHRHYDPSTGRYLQPDPMGLATLLTDGASVYGYARHSPLVWLDPSGLDPFFGGPGSFAWADAQSYAAEQQAATAVSSTARLPDYVAANMVIGYGAGLSFSGSIDRYGDTFYSPFFGAGGSWPVSPISGSLTCSWLLQPDMPSQDQLSKFLSANGFSMTVGYGPAVTGSYTPGAGYSLGVGISSPQAGGAYNYSFSGANLGFTW